MSRVTIFLVAGARPNFMKIAPIYKELAGHEKFAPQFVHTGQHYDEELSGVFLRDLGLPSPDIMLEAGSGSHGMQTGRILERFESVLLERKPDLVMVVGDVNSTLACALATVKMRYPSGGKPSLAHVEAGLRSFDRNMPEEINRVLTDALADFLFITERSASENLSREGIPADRIFFVGNVMIDTLLERADRASSLKTWERLGLKKNAYAVVTLHRPSNVDDRENLAQLVKALVEIGKRIPIVFPAHPRTLKRLLEFGLEQMICNGRGIHIVSPMGYLEFLSLMSCARLIVTDSGGIQEESTILGIPCVTLRENTERPVTVEVGTNTLISPTGANLLAVVDEILMGKRTRHGTPELWDGKAAKRIVQVLDDYYDRLISCR